MLFNTFLLLTFASQINIINVKQAKKRFSYEWNLKIFHKIMLHFIA